MRTRDENKEACIRVRAMEMIVSEGFEGLSMQKLAKAAGVSPATIYIYWKNREDLLNQLFQDVQLTFSNLALEGFNSEMSLEEGLWLQWQNRLRFIREYPIQFAFFEQFRHSPLINRGDLKFAMIKESMQQFTANAVANGELKPMPQEVYWSVAFAPFYSLVRCKYQGKSMMSDCFDLTEDVLRMTFQMVIQALKPQRQS